jgi:hypothetical protein
MLIIAYVDHRGSMGGTAMVRRFLLSGVVALGIAGTASVNAAAQPFTEGAAAAAIRDAYALAAQIRGFHRWQGLTLPPPGYCDTMREGEAVMKELARLSSRAVLYRLPGVALRLQRAGDGLSDELDQEEEVNRRADIPYTVYPCPAPPGPYPARPLMLSLILPRMPACRVQADAVRVSFDARRTLMQQCLRIPGT